MVVVVIFLTVVAPLTVPVLMGWPPLVVGVPVFPFSGLTVGEGLGDIDGVGVAEAMGVGLVLGVGNILENKPLTPRKLTTPTATNITTVNRPTINCFICPILYATLSNIIYIVYIGT